MLEVDRFADPEDADRLLDEMLFITIFNKYCSVAY